MSTYILIHGAWHGAWCWNKVVSLLEKEGHAVVAPDLPGHGDDKTPIAKVTLRAYADCVCEVINIQSDHHSSLRLKSWLVISFLCNSRKSNITNRSYQLLSCAFIESFRTVNHDGNCR